MTEKRPLKRNKALKPFSIDHHHGLLLSWKIRTGLRKSIDPTRIGNYVKWFFEHHLQPHFELEEKYMFPVLGPGDELVIRACKDHQDITALMASAQETGALVKIADTLEAHIRFEERILFEKIQTSATPEQLEQIERIHTNEKFVEHLDEFWKQ